jgi:hypothetical protein
MSGHHQSRHFQGALQHRYGPRRRCRLQNRCHWKESEPTHLHIVPRLANTNTIILSQSFQQADTLAKHALPSPRVVKLRVLIYSLFLEQGSRAVFVGKESGKILNDLCIPKCHDESPDCSSRMQEVSPNLRPGQIHRDSETNGRSGPFERRVQFSEVPTELSHRLRRGPLNQGRSTRAVFATYAQCADERNGHAGWFAIVLHVSVLVGGVFAFNYMRDENNELWLSPVNTWEALRLHAKGRIRLHGDVRDWMEKAAVHMREAPLT